MDEVAPDLVRALSARYTGEAEAYRTLWAPALLPMIRAQLDALQTPPVRRALDIGTGVGSALPHLQRRFPGARVVGVDRALGMLRAAPREAALAQMDAAALGLASRSCDFVLMAFVLFHLPDPHAGLVEARRVLRAGGRLAVSTWAGDAVCAAMRIWDEELDAHGATPLEELEHLAQHDLMDSPEKLRALLDVAGFVDVQAERRAFKHRMTVAEFMGLRTRLGRSRRRFESLDEARRQECYARADDRLKSLSRDALTLHMPVVLASATIAP